MIFSVDTIKNKEFHAKIAKIAKLKPLRNCLQSLNIF